MQIKNKIKSVVVSSVMAVGAIAAPLSSALTPSLSAGAAGAGDDYAKLLQYSLYFYDANMCGDQVEEAGKLSWRSDCHTSDSVTGGFHDAGDHVKFGLPAGYSAAVLDWGYYEFSDSYDSSGQTAHLKDITDYFAKFFRDSTTLSGNSVSNFVYQIGDGNADHAEWCAPEVQSSASRKTYSTSSGASDIAAAYSAALAAHYVNFGNAEDLKYAKALFEFSTKYNQCAKDGASDFYNSFDYYDDQAFAAGWLYLATNDSTYKTFLNTFMNSSNKGSSGLSGCQWGVYSTLSWNNVSMGAAILQAEITKSSSDWNKVTTYIDNHGGTSSSYYFETKWGSARYNTAQQFAAILASKYGAKDYYSWSKGQMDYILGNKSVGSASATCFVVGLTDNSAKYAHHRAASGYSSFDEMGKNSQYSSNGHVLVGALVGGPLDANGTYNDTVQDYEANEVTLDYNAALVGAAAGLYSKYNTGSAVDPSTIPGVKGGSTPITTTTTTSGGDTTATTTSPDKTTTTTTTTAPVQTDKRVVEVSVPSGATELSFQLKGADEVEAVINTNGGKISGAFDYSDTSGQYMQFGTFDTTSDTITADVAGIQAQNDTVTLHIWWSENGATISKVNLIYHEAVTTTTTKKTTTTTTTTTTSTTTTSSNTTENDILYGDANCDGKVDISDAVMILQALSNKDKYGVTGSDPTHITEQGMKNADCNKSRDGVTTSDALAVQKYVIGLVNFPLD